MAEGGLPEARSVGDPETVALVSAADTITIFKDAILTILTVPTHITDDLQNSGILDDDDVTTIEQREQQKDQQGAVSMLLDKLRTAILSEENHFDAFLQALEKADYTLLASILKHGRGCTSTSHFVALMGRQFQTFIAVILSNTDRDQALAAVEGLATAMEEKELVEEGDATSAKEELEEPIPAVVLTYLVFCMCRRDDNPWPRPFLTLLLDQGYEDLVKQLAAVIDPELIKILEPEQAVDGPDEVSIDEQLNYVLAHFKDALKPTLRPGKIVRHLSNIYDGLGTFAERQRRIRKLEQSGKRGIAVVELLNDVISSTAPGKWQSLKEALKKTKHTKEITLLEGVSSSLTYGEERDKSCDFQESVEQENLLKVFMEELQDKLYPLPLLNRLQDNGVLEQDDCKEVENCHRNEGPENAVLLLILKVNLNKRRGWFKELLRAMALEDYWDLVKLIDEKMFNELTEELQGPTMHEEEEEGSMTVAAAEGCEASLKAGMTEPLPSELPSASVSPGRLTEPSHDSPQRTGVSAVLTSGEKLEANLNGNHLEANPQKPTPDKKLSPNIRTDENFPSAASETEATARSTNQNAADPEDIPVGEQEKLQLRSYQDELAQDALAGRNVVICAPTGSGKTLVAAALSKAHLEAKKGGKIAFVVDKVALVEQQENQFRRFLDKKYKFARISSQNPLPLREILDMNDVFFLTAQILVDALRNGDVASVKAFTLIILDECHHTDKSHPYSRIMDKYLDEKSDLAAASAPLPQVVGLTASPGTGNARDLEGAQKHILKLCARMDAHVLRTPKEHKEDLDLHVPTPEERPPIEVRGRTDDPFTQLVNGLMQNIEDMMRDVPELAKLEKVKQCLKVSMERGSVRYTQWHSELKKAVDEERTCASASRRTFVTCIDRLQTYNEALIINADCRTKDALEYVENAFKYHEENRFDEPEKTLMTMWEGISGSLKSYSERSGNQNPKLEKLRGIVAEAYREKSDSRGILFCKTRALTVALQAWMMETDELKELNPGRLVGVNAQRSKTGAGMTQNMQEGTLKKFREGHHKLIVATSVAEEGLDIKECNLIVVYDHVTNEIAHVQVRGRGRAEDSKFIVIAQKGSGVAEKIEVNRVREALMNEATEKVMSMTEGQFCEEVEKYQRELKLDRRQAEQAANAPRNSASPEQYQFCCRKCDVKALYGSDVRKLQDSHFVVIHEDFLSQCKVKHKEPVMFGADFGKAGKISCLRCNEDWGGMCVYKNAKFPQIKISQFVVVDRAGNRKNLKKWKQVPFTVEPFTVDDLEQRLFLDHQEDGTPSDSSETD